MYSSASPSAQWYGTQRSPRALVSNQRAKSGAVARTSAAPPPPSTASSIASNAARPSASLRATSRAYSHRSCPRRKWTNSDTSRSFGVSVPSAARQPVMISVSF